MKNVKFSRRSFLKAGAAASVASLVAANAAVASAAEPKAAAQENGLFDGMFGGKTPKYIFLFIGDGMGVAQIQSASFYKGTVENNGAVTPAPPPSAPTPLPPPPPSLRAKRPSPASST